MKKVSRIILNFCWPNGCTTSYYGKFMLTVLSGISELEADMIRERQAEDIALSNERGVYKDRPRKYSKYNAGSQHGIELMQKRNENKLTVRDIENITKLSRATLYRELKRAEAVKKLFYFLRKSAPLIEALQKV